MLVVTSSAVGKAVPYFLIQLSGKLLDRALVENKHMSVWQK